MSLASDNARLRTERDRARRELERARAEITRLEHLVDRIGLSGRSREILVTVTGTLRLAEYHGDPVSSAPITGTTFKSAERPNEGAATEYARHTLTTLATEIEHDCALARAALERGRRLRRRGDRYRAVLML